MATIHSDSHHFGSTIRLHFANQHYNKSSSTSQQKAQEFTNLISNSSNTESGIGMDNKSVENQASNYFSELSEETSKLVLEVLSKVMNSAAIATEATLEAAANEVEFANLPEYKHGASANARSALYNFSYALGEPILPRLLQILFLKVGGILGVALKSISLASSTGAIQRQVFLRESVEMDNAWQEAQKNGLIGDSLAENIGITTFDGIYDSTRINLLTESEIKRMLDLINKASEIFTKNVVYGESDTDIDRSAKALGNYIFSLMSLVKAPIDSIARVFGQDNGKDNLAQASAHLKTANSEIRDMALWDNQERRYKRIQNEIAQAQSDPEKFIELTQWIREITADHDDGSKLRYELMNTNRMKSLLFVLQDKGDDANYIHLIKQLQQDNKNVENLLVGIWLTLEFNNSVWEQHFKQITEQKAK